MPTYLPFVLIGVVAVGLIVWSLVTQRGRMRAQKAASERLGFRPCPDEKAWLEETVTRIENNQGFRYEVRDPKRWSEEPPVYTYDKIRYQDARGDDVVPVAEQEVLFPLKRASAGAIVVTVKPSSLAPGLATRVIGAIAAGPWDAQPDDLYRLELPPDLKGTNLMRVLGPSGASLYDLVDGDTISVMQGLGDAGGIFVRVRDGWCSVASASSQIPFRLDELLARIRPLL